MTIYVGEQIQAEFGIWPWDGNPTSLSYQWQDSLDGITFNADLAGETQSDYIVAWSEVDRWVGVRVVATNAGGSSAPSDSDWYGPIEPSVGPPTDAVYGIAFVSGVPTFVQVRPT